MRVTEIAAFTAIAVFIIWTVWLVCWIEFPRMTALIRSLSGLWRGDGKNPIDRVAKLWKIKLLEIREEENTFGPRLHDVPISATLSPCSSLTSIFAVFTAPSNRHPHKPPT
jgi:hypothetical protein